MGRGYGGKMVRRGGGRRLTMAEIVFQAFICCDFTQMRFKLGRGEIDREIDTV